MVSRTANGRYKVHMVFVFIFIYVFIKKIISE